MAISDEGNGVRSISATNAAIVASSDSGEGLSADTGTGTAVSGTSEYGTGIAAFSYSGTGLSAKSINGNALRVDGPAVFTRSGKLVIQAGKTSVTKTGVNLTKSSIVMVTPQTNAAGLAVRCAVPDILHKSFTVHLARALDKAVTIGWFVVN